MSTITKETLESWYQPKLSVEDEERLRYEKLQEEADDRDKSFRDNEE